MAKYKYCLFLSIIIYTLYELLNGGNLAARLEQLWFGQQHECQKLQQYIHPLEPIRQIQHDAGVTEIWDQQMQCVGVAATRHVIEPRGLLLPSFNNAPMLLYVRQGRGILGTILPGCPETYQSFDESSYVYQGGSEYSRRRRPRDQHQNIYFFRQGDVIALPTGVAHWTYNDGDDALVLIVVHHTNNNQNQLDHNLRNFFLAGNNPQRRQQWSYRIRQQEIGNNIMQGFNAEILADAFNVDIYTARQPQNQDDDRGFIVRVDKGLKLARPQMEELDEIAEKTTANGFEETMCSMRIKENIDDPERADIYSSKGGRISTVNSLKLPILKRVQLSAERGILYKNAMMDPHWNINAHSMMYVIRGSGHVQIVGPNNRPAFDGEIRQGQLIVIPQNFVVVKLSWDKGLEWISFKTNDNAVINTLSGKTSAMSAMPVDVVASAYRISREDARRLKYNREEVTIHSQRRSSQGRGSWSFV